MRTSQVAVAAMSWKSLLQASANNCLAWDGTRNMLGDKIASYCDECSVSCARFPVKL